MRHRVSAAGFLAILSLIVSTTAFAGDSTTVARSVRSITATHINPHPPTIDGNLSDPIWTSHEFDYARNFIQRDPDEGEAATESTLVAVAYDDEALYFAFWCFDDDPDQIQRQLVRRDRDSQSDLVVVRLDPFHDRLTGYQFYVSAAGVLQDGRIYNDDWTDGSWDAVWEASAKIHSWGWAAEYKIPFSCLRFAPGENQTWGIDFSRLVNRKDEVTRWSYCPKSESGLASRFGDLKGLSGIHPGRHFEVLPYTVSKTELSDKTKGNPDGRDFKSNVGVDLKYGLTTNLTLDATINPDFGQVELDAPVLNLSAFETYFSEKRPFFIEGSDLFETNYQLFYSRRIGRSPRGRINDTLYDYTIDRPAATSILGAAKLTGKLGSGTSIAALSAVTQEEHEEYRTTDGAKRSGVVEPTANYSVVRVKQDILGNSHIGGIVTLASQDTYHPAMTGGVDWRLNTKDNQWNLNGQTVFSRVDDQDIGFAVDATIQKRGGEHWRGSVGIVNKDPNLNINRLGFTNRNDFREIWSWIQYRTQNDWWIVRNTWNNINYWKAWNYAGYDISHGGNFNTNIELKNKWWINGGVEVQGEKYDDFETRGNGIWEYPVHPTFAWWANVETNPQKKLSFNVNPGSGGDRGGTWWSNYVGVNYRPKSNIQLSSGVNYHRSFDATRWVDNVDVDDNEDTPDQAVFADLDKDQVSLNLTASVMITRNLSWQLSGQGLISSLRYRDYKRYLGGNDYARDVEPLNEDGTFSSLNSMMLVRWEYLPGSTIYFVWTRDRSEFDDSVDKLHINDELNRFFSRGSDNVWLLKVAYWWNI